MTSTEFLRSYYGAESKESFSVNYRIAEGCAIQSIDITIAAKKLEKDIEDMRQFFREHGADVSKAEEATYFIWKRDKLVRYS